MVIVKFFNLIRSRHNVKQCEVHPGTIDEIIAQIQQQHPTITKEELNQAILFINKEKVMHLKRFDEAVSEGDTIVFTNFVGGG